MGGEKMKKKILVISVLLLTVAMLTIPVMAAPAKKIEGVTSTPGIPVRMIFPGYPRNYDNGISHNRGNTSQTITLTIPGLGPSGSDLVLVGSHYSEWRSKSKFIGPDPEAIAIITAMVVWTFPGGTFEGRVYRTITGLPISGSSITYTRTILHGTGDFLGQTVKLIDGTGYIIIPK
jgi:hypothetical protein